MLVSSVQTLNQQAKQFNVIPTQVVVSLQKSPVINATTIALLAGKVGCRRVKTRVKTTDMCLSGRRVADMLADMSAT